VDSTGHRPIDGTAVADNGAANADAVADRWAACDGTGIVAAAGSAGALDGDAGVDMKPAKANKIVNAFVCGSFF
jgi:hypothetical protein